MISKQTIRVIFLLIVSLYSLNASTQDEILDKALTKKLYSKTEWHALIGYDEKFMTEDKTFLLDPVSPKEELIATIKSFFTPAKEYENINSHPLCRYPARRLFITHELDISNELFPKVECKDFDTYLKKAPADSIYLIYASEKVNNPSTMMGHSFIKIAGKNAKGIFVEHAVSFHTVIDTFNILKLGWENLVSGMRGIYTLQPYKNVLLGYTDKEDRNLWEYKLKLNDYRRKLIYYHLWELKNVHMKYYFTSYNCSTVIYYLLLLAKPKMQNDIKLWVTPLELVKMIYKYNLVSKATLHPSKEWLVKMYAEQVPFSTERSIKEIVDNNKYDEIAKLDIYSLKLLEAYLDFRFSKQQISKNEYLHLRKLIKKSKNYKPLNIDLSNYKLPYKTPPERQFGMGFAQMDHTAYAKFSFLGASHFLNDDNTEFMSESELKIGYLSLLVNTKSIKLEEFTLYGMKSYIPFDILTNDLSYQFEMSVKKEFTKTFTMQDTLKIDGGIGVDFLILNDINIFVLINGGVGYNRADSAHLFLNPEIGFMIYEVLGMKSLFYYEPNFKSSGFSYDKIVFEHNIFLKRSYKLFFHYEKFLAEKKLTNYSFGVSLLF